MIPGPDARSQQGAALRDHLITVAREARTVTYFEAAGAVGHRLHTPEARASFATLLRDISTREHQAGRPLLSALVVLQGNRRPGQGFFDLAAELGLLGDKSPDEFHRDEVDRVHAYWKTLSA